MTDEVWESRRRSFGAQAQAYAAGRPPYPADALRWALPPGARHVLDLGAGSGALTAALLELGFAVTAVEPLDEMRALVPASATALAGTAEDIPLPDGSVDAVAVGQAFHWFDLPRALPEMRRVLRPQGHVVLLWNLLDDGVGWVQRVLDVFSGEERASWTSADEQPPYGEGFGLSMPTRSVFRHDVPYDARRMTAYVASRSQTILLPDDERADLLARVSEACPAGTFALPLVCVTWRGHRVD